MSASKLAELYVQLSVRGQQAVESTLGRVQRVVTGLHGTMQTMGRVAGKAFLAIQGGLLGFIYAGTRGTAVGTQFGFVMEMLAREIASAFLPAILRVLGALRSLTEWFRSLSGAQQDQVMKWGLITVGVLGFLAVLPKLVAVGSAVVGVLGAMGLAYAAIAIAAAAATYAVYDIASAFNEGETATEGWIKSLRTLGGMLKLFGKVAPLSGLGLVGNLLPEDEEAKAGIARRFQDRLKGLAGSTGITGMLDSLSGLLQGGGGQGRRDLAFGQPGFESPTETFKRVSVAAGMADMGSIDQQQLDMLKGLRDAVNGIRDLVGNSQPIVTPSAGGGGGAF